LRGYRQTLSFLKKDEKKAVNQEFSEIKPIYPAIASPYYDINEGVKALKLYPIMSSKSDRLPSFSYF
jgi:hypothetical protein